MDFNDNTGKASPYTAKCKSHRCVEIVQTDKSNFRRIGTLPVQRRILLQHNQSNDDHSVNYVGTDQYAAINKLHKKKRFRNNTGITPTDHYPEYSKFISTLPSSNRQTKTKQKSCFECTRNYNNLDKNSLESNYVCFTTPNYNKSQYSQTLLSNNSGKACARFQRSISSNSIKKSAHISMRKVISEKSNKNIITKKKFYPDDYIDKCNEYDSNHRSHSKCSFDNGQVSYKTMSYLKKKPKKRVLTNLLIIGLILILIVSLIGFILYYQNLFNIIRDDIDKSHGTEKVKFVNTSIPKNNFSLSKVPDETDLVFSFLWQQSEQQKVLFMNSVVLSGKLYSIGVDNSYIEYRNVEKSETDISNYITLIITFLNIVVSKETTIDVCLKAIFEYSSGNTVKKIFVLKHDKTDRSGKHSISLPNVLQNSLYPQNKLSSIIFTVLNGGGLFDRGNEFSSSLLLSSLKTRVAFSVYIESDVSHVYQMKRLMFHEILFNHGYGFNLQQSEFIAPLDGIYVFFVNAIVERFNSTYITVNHMNRYKNSEILKYSMEMEGYNPEHFVKDDSIKNTPKFGYETIGRILIFDMKMYDKIYVTKMCNERQVTFSGFLQYEINDDSAYYTVACIADGLAFSKKNSKENKLRFSYIKHENPKLFWLDSYSLSIPISGVYIVHLTFYLSNNFDFLIMINSRKIRTINWSIRSNEKLYVLFPKKEFSSYTFYIKVKKGDVFQIMIDDIEEKEKYISSSKDCLNSITVYLSK
ncbi:hypothetical protein A3Q56_02088 [Intoshia linei]|uniref:C1q domain-containing protein n=1 Tax=Intoshia linei TaxID=1819745 RepID=A0A177B943_9BILA|nr:hypothetical protein A3Q56_02088 [Intoshia linei]